MPAVSVFNRLRTSYFVQVHPSEVDSVPGGEDDKLMSIEIPPGPSEIDEDLWEHLKTKDSVESRLENRVLVETEPNKSMLRQLTGSVDRSFITALCSKSREVPDNEVFDAARATSPDGARREIEDQWENFKENVPTIGG